jgi:hypothetical protein
LVERNKAKKRLQSRFNHALEALEKKSSRPGHGSTFHLSIMFPDGTMRKMTLAMSALVFARMLVRDNQELPTKGALRLEIEKQYPEAKGLDESAWLRAWKDAGLIDLPQEQQWRLPPRKRKIKR